MNTVKVWILCKKNLWGLDLFLAANQFSITGINSSILFLDTILIRFNLTPNQTPKADPTSALCLLGVCYGFTGVQLLGFTHWNVKQTHYSLTACKPAHCIFQIHVEIFGHFSVPIMHLLMILGPALYVWSSWVSRGLLGVSSGFTIADPKKTLSSPRKQTPGLAEAYFLLGWVWLIL